MTITKPKDGQRVEVYLDKKWALAVFREDEYERCFILDSGECWFIEPQKDLPLWRADPSPPPKEVMGFRTSGRFRFPLRPQGLDPFARWIEEYGKRQHVRDRVLYGSDHARKEPLTPWARGSLGNHRDEFIKHFDALEEGAPEGIFLAIEAAFHLGMFEAATRFRKEVPRVHMEDKAAYMRKKKGETPRPPNAIEAAVRAAMDSRTSISLGGARLIKGKVDKIVGKDVPANTIFMKLKKINRAKKIQRTVSTRPVSI